MPAPIPDLSRDQQCHHYQAPSGQRCGSPALKGEYYCYHHHIKHASRNRRPLIDPEVTCMEIAPIEDRASIFNALAAVVHRLAENTIDTSRAGRMIYGLQVALRALEPPRAPRTATNPRVPASSPLHRHDSGVTCAASGPNESGQQASAPPSGESQAPKTILITKESLVYFLRSRHCYNCNAELFPAEELTYRRHPGAPAEVIEEANPRLAASEAVILSDAPALTEGAQPETLPRTRRGDPDDINPATAGRSFQPQPENERSAETPENAPIHTTGPIPSLQAVAENRSPAQEYGRPIHINPSIMGAEGPPQSTFIAPFALHSPRRSVSLRLVRTASHIPVPGTTRPHRILNHQINRRTKWQQ